MIKCPWVAGFLLGQGYDVVDFSMADKRSLSQSNSTSTVSYAVQIQLYA
jgi:hypothetical protein